MKWLLSLVTGSIWPIVGVAVALGAVGVYAWDADRALKREHEARISAENRATLFGDALRQCREDAADRNRRWADVLKLPEVRVRLCSQRDPTDGCCKPAPAECKP